MTQDCLTVASLGLCSCCSPQRFCRLSSAAGQCNASSCTKCFYHSTLSSELPHMRALANLTFHLSCVTSGSICSFVLRLRLPEWWTQGNNFLQHFSSAENTRNSTRRHVSCACLLGHAQSKYCLGPVLITAAMIQGRIRQQIIPVHSDW